MKIGLWGAYGKNFGDNIMMNIILDTLINKYHYDVIIFSKYTEIDGLEKYKNIQYIQFNSLSILRKIKVLKKYSKDTFHIWGGGTNFTDQDGCGNPFPFIVLKIFSSKFGYLCIGINSLKKNRRILLAKIMLNLSSFTSVRDELSKQYIEKELKIKKNIYLGSDLVYSYLSEISTSGYNKSTKEKYIIFTTRNLENYLYKDNYSQYIRICSQLLYKISEQLKIKTINLIVTDCLIDTLQAQEIKTHLQKHDKDITVSVINTQSINDIVELLKDSSFNVSTRLHTSMISETFCIPTLTLSYSDKIKYYYLENNKSNYITINNSINWAELLELSLKMFQKIIYNSNYYHDSLKRIEDFKNKNDIIFNKLYNLLENQSIEGEFPNV